MLFLTPKINFFPNVRIGRRMTRSDVKKKSVFWSIYGILDQNTITGVTNGSFSSNSSLGFLIPFLRVRPAQSRNYRQRQQSFLIDHKGPPVFKPFRNLVQILGCRRVT